MRDAVVVAAVRSPVGKRNGSLSTVHPADLSAHVLQELARRSDLDPSVVDDVVWGCVSQAGEQTFDIARTAVLSAGWPESVPGTTIDRQCGSSQQAIHFAAAGIVSGQYDVAVAGGVESMSRVPMGSAAGTQSPLGELYAKRYSPEFPSQGLGAETIARRWSLSRTQLDDYALQSHARADNASRGGAFSGQMVPIETAAGAFVVDEGIRPGSTLDILGTLKTPFLPDGRISAGNSSQISDGSAALLLTTSEYAASHGWKPLVRVHTAVVAGSEPNVMLTGPIPATEKLLAKSGISLSDIGAFEVNEAFASVVLAWQSEFKVADELLNPLGGAIALGHPLGGSGARIATTLISHMVDNDIRYGMQTMCEGGGQANATLFELVGAGTRGRG
ncbi:acetyl-CoA acetyltransferase [Rhodococcus sp. SC4]|uniref:thiolase family protein n=1 Tax=unclassified Rhodococcus (in: high G+C Gram-positive bacteria) TaxID=192944 RepID=UPI00076AC02B|nr:MULTISPECIES: thiolase family protein [unclassified Rhodococcus (in: high G+C Gram-positive bacteria)]KXF53914.1 acetyl-CoA acetyltransferase [Rhodococcus sp. SC4]KXX57457.1 acetyl-CoA acetyltransferase [Rhodococcus sp. LB1]PBC57909.1 acetyl-CoA C-acyltransferase [Rhodococcus sp. ACPA1]